MTRFLCARQLARIVRGLRIGKGFDAEAIPLAV
jgi:hypothetical protein